MSKLLGHHLIIFPNGEVEVKGVDYGPRITVHHPEFIVIKTSAHQTWSGRGQTRSVKGRYLVYRILAADGRPGENEQLDVEPLFEMPLRKEG